ncbi:MAG: AAA family ATPase [Thermoplasmata archaeon]
MSPVNVFRQYSRATLFTNRMALSYDFIPPELPHRQEQIKRLVSLFMPLIESGIPQNAFLTGPVGTGKTVTSRVFSSDLVSFAREKGIAIKHIHINCRRRPTDAGVLLEIIRSFDAHFPDRGFSVNEMLDILRKHIEMTRSSLLIILDEADHLFGKADGTEIIYLISRFNEERPLASCTVSLILISTMPTLPLDSASASTFKRTHKIEFPKYNVKELADIVSQRAKLALEPGVAGPDTIDAIALAAADLGDARFAIELLEGAGLRAEEEGAPCITPEHVRAAKAHTYLVVDDSKLKDISKPARILLLSIARKFARSADAEIPTQEIEKLYPVVCEEYGEPVRGHTQVWKYFKTLEAAGIIHISKKTDGKKTFNVVKLVDVPAKELEERLNTMLRIN